MALELHDRFSGINANLDDLQSGIEACARAADAFHTDAAGFVEILTRMNNASLIDALMKHANKLQTCARDQRGALRELRRAFTRLQAELKRSNGAVRPPPDCAADRSRR